MIGGRLQRWKDGRVTIVGVDHGAVGQVLAENDKFIVIKWPGRTCYLNRMSGSRYFSPETYVCRKTNLVNGETTVEPVIGWKTQRKAKGP